MESISLHQAQKIIASDEHRFRVINCGRRFGKTTLAVLEIVGKACLNKKQKIAYIAPTYPQARDIAWHEFQKRLPLGSSASPKYNESRLEISLNNGSHVWLKGWENIETVRGQAFDFLVIDEVAMMKDFWLYWQEVLRPTLTDTKGEVMFISTPKGFNHFYDLYNLEREDLSFKSFHFISKDNPFIPTEEIDDAEKQMTKDRFAQEYLADFRKSEGLVYKEFDRGLHVVDAIPERSCKKVAAVDFGYTNPCAILDIRVDYDNNVWVLNEHYKTQRTNEEIVEYTKSLEPNLVYPDPEAPEKIRQLKESGLNCREVKKGKGSVISGIDKVRELFKQNRIKIHKSCVNLICELEIYHYPEELIGRKVLDKNPREEPVKEHDHALDALRYFVSMFSMQSEVPIVVKSNITYNRR